MNKYFRSVFYALLAIFVLAGCAYKINPQSINAEILPKDSISIANFMTSKTYSTYDSKLEKIMMYHFKNIGGKLRASFSISYIPIDYYYELYSDFSDVTMTLRFLTNGKETTLEGALEAEVARNHYTRLFKDKDEFIIGNKFAFEIQMAIQRYQDSIQRYERDDAQDMIRE